MSAAWAGALPVVYHPAYDAPLPPGHRFPMGKFAALADVLVADGLVTPGGFATPDLATPDDLCRVHDPAYVAAVLRADVSHALARQIGLPITAEVALRAQAATGGTLLAARLALIHGRAANTAGGSHHAGPDAGAGFCVFNDVAVAAAALLAEGAIRQALVLDLDVHQGDGTAKIFAARPEVTTVSMHCDKNYPSRKAHSDVDVEVPVGTGDGAYLDLLEQVLTALPHQQRRPDLVFYIAGVDPHQDDQLGKLCLTDVGLWARDQRVVRFAKDLGVPLVGVLGGGYGPTVDALARRHAVMHRALAGWPAP